MRLSRNAAEKRNAASSRPLFRYLKTPHREVEADDARPETRDFVKLFTADVKSLVAGAESQHLQDHHEQGQPHGQLRKQVVIGDGKRELNAVPEHTIRHRLISGDLSLSSW
jgi:hypothetical protein